MTGRSLTEAEFDALSPGDLIDWVDVDPQAEAELQEAHARGCLWTIVEGDDGGDGPLYAVPGWHHVNRVGYVVTEHPCPDDVDDAIFCDSNDDGEG